MNRTHTNGYFPTIANGYGEGHAASGRYQNGEASTNGRDGTLAPGSANLNGGGLGYGGLGSPDNLDGVGRERPLARITDLERRRANRRSGDRGTHASRSRSRPRNGGANQQIEGQRRITTAAWKCIIGQAVFKAEGVEANICLYRCATIHQSKLEVYDSRRMCTSASSSAAA